MRNQQALRKETDLAAPTAPGPERQLRVADAAHAGVPSPATAIQQQLDLEWRARAAAAAPARWAPRSTLLFAGSVSLALWAVIAAAAYAALK